MKIRFVFFSLGVLAPLLIFSQGRTYRGTISGTVVDADDKMPVTQATIQVLSPKDSTMIAGNVTDMDGKFAINTRFGKYLLKVSFVGYKTVFRDVEISRQKPKFNSGNIELSSDAIMLEGAVVVGQAPEVTAVDDTLVYNSSAYRVPEGSALEELVKKLPGAEIDDNGKITINGKEISKIMLDGKEFFADDPNIALKNLPVNIIDKLRTYEKQSDMAKATGIQDGEEETVLDLTVKPGMNKGWFGNADVAGGTHDRYSGKVLMNRFYEGNQFTVIGSSNNVNDNGFPGGGGGGWWGQNGLNTIHTAGFNFATETKKWQNNGSVNFNIKDSDIRSKSASETFVSNNTSSFTNERNLQNNRNLNLTADFRIEWNPDTTTMMLLRPRFQYGDSDNETNSNTYTFNQDPGYSTDELIEADEKNDGLTQLVPEENIINSIIRNSLSRSNSLTYGASLMYNKRLRKAGRNITLRGYFNYTDSESEQFSTSETNYFQMTTPDEQQDILNRYITTPTKSYNYSARISYSEPIRKNMFLQFSYNFQYRRNTSDNSTYDMPNEWTVPQGLAGDINGTRNDSLSKSAAYEYYNHQVDVSYRWITEKSQLNLGLSFQPQNTELDYKKGELDTVCIRKVFNFTPTLDYRYRFSKTSQLRIDYRGRSSQPSMTDLLPIEDNTDPLNIRQGNPNLKPSFTNTLRINYNTFNMETQKGCMAFFTYSNTLNSISNRRTYNEETGGYVTKPENINGNWNIFGVVGGNIALKNKKYTINTFTNTRYSNMVSYISSKEETTNSDKNITKQLNLGERLRGTYRTDWWEISLNGSINYMHSRNSYRSSGNMDTYQFSYGGSTNVNLPWNMSISTDLSQNSRRGYADASMNRDELLWNAQISQNFLKGKAATVSVQFYDILKNRSNISRVISSAMRSDSEYNSIYSYCMVHFIYRLNLFGGGQGGRPMGGPGFGPPGRGSGPGFGGRR